MDKKAEKLFEHYKGIIENNRFDEYDILGFLIFMRNYLEPSQFPAIYEYCDLVAHRHRDRGKTMNCVKNAINNNYVLLGNSNKVKGYQGISEQQLEKEWLRFGKQFQIAITNQTIKEIILCIYSITQFTEYHSGSYSGTIVLIQGKEKKLSLATTDNKASSPYVCFSSFKPYDFLYEYPGGLITDVVETKRINGELQLFAKDLRII